MDERDLIDGIDVNPVVKSDKINYDFLQYLKDPNSTFHKSYDIMTNYTMKTNETLNETTNTMETNETINETTNIMETNEPINDTINTMDTNEWLNETNTMDTNKWLNDTNTNDMIMIGNNMINTQAPNTICDLLRA